jgi:acyl-CoA synthetase (NDP forming)
LTQHRPLDPASLAPLFRPRSVAIIGASDDQNKVGGRPIHFLKAAGFRGVIHPVNPRGGTLQGLATSRSLADIDGAIDQAIIALAAPQVLGALRDCVSRGIRAVQIFAAGFAEQGEEGQRAQAEIAALVRDSGTRVLGPNSLGLFEVHDGFFGTFSTALDGAWPRAGSVGLATQSGAFGSYAYGLAQARGLGFSAFVATGNEVDVDVADCVAWLARDDRTRVILVTLEGARDGRRLMAALAMARGAGKPVIAMKVGVSAAGAVAAASHTGSLAGADALYDAAFRQAGVHRAGTIEEMIDVAYACSATRPPSGKRLGIATTSGGVGVLLADAASAHGLELPQPSDEVRRQVTELVPFASGRNPLDTSAAILGDMAMFARLLDLMIAGCELDSVLCFLAHVGRNAAHMAQLEPALVALRARHPDKTVMLSLLCDAEVTARLERAGFLVFAEPSRAVRALAAATRLAVRPPSALRHVPEIQPPQHFPSRLTEHEARAVLAKAGIAVAAECVATTADEGREAARALGFPVAMKILSADVAHKSDIGAVLLDLKTENEVAAGFDLILSRVREAMPDAAIAGVLVSPMVRGVAETILGARRDTVFGPVVMFGLGGVFVEIFRDVTFRAAPFGHDVAHAMIREIAAFPLLDGARGRPKADLDALAEALVRLSEFAAANADTVAEVDINPFVIGERGGFAVDALIVPVGAAMRIDPAH